VSADKAVPSFGDNVRVRPTPETESLGIAGLCGNVHGVTTPSVTNIVAIGGAPGNVALNVVIEGQPSGLWLNPDLVEFVDHAPGSEITLDGVPKKWTRTEDGGWREEQLAPSKRWWQFWK
jgi:hypothetical protein